MGPIQPALISGTLKKKSPAKMGGWKERHFEVRAPGWLYYMKVPDPNPNKQTKRRGSQDVLGVIDLRLVEDISIHRRSNGDVFKERFNIEVPNRKFKLQAPSVAEAQTWVARLQVRECVRARPLLNWPLSH